MYTDITVRVKTDPEQIIWTLFTQTQLSYRYTKEDGTKFTQNDIVQLQLKAASINQGMHGIYNKIDSNMIQMVATVRR